MADLQLEVAHLRQELARERALRLAAESARDAGLAALRVAVRSIHDATAMVLLIARSSFFCAECTEHPRTPHARSADARTE